MPNFAENQERWDKGDVSVDACRRKGAELASYGFSPFGGLGFKASEEQERAFKQGYVDEMKRMGRESWLAPGWIEYASPTEPKP